MILIIYKQTDKYASYWGPEIKISNIERIDLADFHLYKFKLNEHDNHYEAFL